MDKTKLPIMGWIDSFLIGLGVSMIGWVNVIVGGMLFGVGVILLVIQITKWRNQKRKYTIPESFENSSTVWGLWHTGERVEGNSIVEKGTPLNRILLFDVCNKKGLTELVEMGTKYGNESDICKEIKDITTKILDLKEPNIEIRWYFEPQCYSMTIYDREKRNLKNYIDLSDSSWIYGEYLQKKINKNKRPSFFIEKCSKKNDEKQSFNAYVKEYEKIWANARPINKIEDMENGKKENQTT